MFMQHVSHVARGPSLHAGLGEGDVLQNGQTSLLVMLVPLLTVTLFAVVLAECLQEGRQSRSCGGDEPSLRALDAWFRQFTDKGRQGRSKKTVQGAAVPAACEVSRQGMTTTFALNMPNLWLRTCGTCRAADIRAASCMLSNTCMLPSRFSPSLTCISSTQHL